TRAPGSEPRACGGTKAMGSRHESDYSGAVIGTPNLVPPVVEFPPELQSHADAKQYLRPRAESALSRKTRAQRQRGESFGRYDRAGGPCEGTGAGRPSQAGLLRFVSRAEGTPDSS